MENSSEHVNFKNYGKYFQEKLAFLILDDRLFADRMVEVLEVNYFEMKYLQVFSSLIFDYKKKYKVHPSRQIMDVLLKNQVQVENDTLRQQLKEYFSRMKDLNDQKDVEYIKSESLDFCKKRRLHEAIMKSIPLLQTNSFEQISKVINTALKLGDEVDSGHEYIKDFEARYVENVRNPITTGWDKIDEVTDGGLGKGQYGLVLGSSGSGKSMLLIHLGAEALKRGYNVLYYTFELSSEVIGLRFDSCTTGIPIDELKSNKEKILETIKKIPGELIIKQYPKKSVSMLAVRNHISRLKNQGFQPHMVIVDYLDLLKPISSDRNKELRHEIGDTYDFFESICQEENLVGWTASQLNRSGYDSKVIRMEQTSEALNKNFGSYLTIGLSRTQEDKNKNTGRLTVCKNRNGPDGMSFNIFMDPANVDIKVLNEYDPNQDIESLVDSKEQKRRMREKFKKQFGEGN